MVRYEVPGVNEHMSFLEMLDVLNEGLIEKGEDPIAFDHDCREGICGMCGFMINGKAHGGFKGTTVCQLHMRHFKDGDELYLEPWRAAAFPVVRDLVVDRSAFDRIIAAGGFISVPTGSPPDGNAIPVRKQDADLAMDAAACIGRGVRGRLPERRGSIVRQREGFALGTSPAGASGTAPSRFGHGAADESRRIRQLHQHWRMRSGLPEADQAGSHRTGQRRLHQGRPYRTPGDRLRQRRLIASLEPLSQQCRGAVFGLQSHRHF